MQPIYGHVSPETAYVVNDYPYGRLRCTIKFWLEMSPKKGFRFVSQTINPKNGRVNAPKPSTYARLGACMYLDEQGHCTWRALTEYSSAEDIMKFAQDFPSADFSIVREFVRAAIPFRQKQAEGKVSLRWKINGVEQEKSEDEQKDERDKAAVELGFLQQAAKLMGLP